MYHQFNIQQLYVLPTQRIYMLYTDLWKKNSYYFPVQHWLFGLYIRDGVCLLRGTDRVFKYDSSKFSSFSPRRPWFNPRPGPCVICVGKSGSETFLSPNTSFFLCLHHCTNATGDPWIRFYNGCFLSLFFN